MVKISIGTIFPWGKFPLGQIPLGTIFLQDKFPLGQTSLGTSFLWDKFPFGLNHFGSVFLLSGKIRTCHIVEIEILHIRHWGFSWFSLLGQTCFGQHYLGPKYYWTIDHWNNKIWVKFLLGNKVLEQISLGEISFGTDYSWVKFPFFGPNMSWARLHWTKMFWTCSVLGKKILGNISVGQHLFGIDFLWDNFPLDQISFG